MKNYHSNELFERIKSEVTMVQVIEQYGIQVKRQLCTCPFHNDTKPSLKVYENSFYCFACGAGGDLIKFVALYNDISNFEAAKIIAHDFGIRVDFDGPIDYVALRRKERERKKHTEFKKWIKNAQDLLCQYHRRLLDDEKRFKPTKAEYDDRFIYAVLTLPTVGEMLDDLSTDDMDKLIQFYNRHRQEVEDIERRIRPAGRAAG